MNELDKLIGPITTLLVFLTTVGGGLITLQNKRAKDEREYLKRQIEDIQEDRKEALARFEEKDQVSKERINVLAQEVDAMRSKFLAELGTSISTAIAVGVKDAIRELKEDIFNDSTPIAQSARRSTVNLNRANNATGRLRRD